MDKVKVVIVEVGLMFHSGGLKVERGRSKGLSSDTLTDTGNVTAVSINLRNQERTSILHIHERSELRIPAFPAADLPAFRTVSRG